MRTAILAGLYLIAEALWMSGTPLQERSAAWSKSIAEQYTLHLALGFFFCAGLDLLYLAIAARSLEAQKGKGVRTDGGG